MNTISKPERARRIQRAQALLLAAGWTVNDSAAGLVADDLMREFGITDRRTARALEAKAALLLSGEVIGAEIGRPRTVVEFRAGDCVEIVTIAGGEAIDASSYSVSTDAAGAMRLTSDERDDLLIRVVEKKHDQNRNGADTARRARRNLYRERRRQ